MKVKSQLFNLQFFLLLNLHRKGLFTFLHGHIHKHQLFYFTFNAPSLQNAYLLCRIQLMILMILYKKNTRRLWIVPSKVRWKSLSKPLAHSQHFRLIKLYACMIILHHKSWGDVIKLKIWLSWANKLNFSWTTWCGALSVVALKKWFRNLHLLNIHVMLLGQHRIYIRTVSS